jgi:hypothetical protein
MRCRGRPTMCQAWAVAPQVRKAVSRPPDAAERAARALDAGLRASRAGFTTRSDIGPARQAPEMPSGIGVRCLPVLAAGRDLREQSVDFARGTLTLTRRGVWGRASRRPRRTPRPRRRLPRRRPTTRPPPARTTPSLTSSWCASAERRPCAGRASIMRCLRRAAPAGQRRGRVRQRGRRVRPGRQGGRSGAPPLLPA